MPSQPQHVPHRVHSRLLAGDSLRGAQGAGGEEDAILGEVAGTIRSGSPMNTSRQAHNQRIAIMLRGLVGLVGFLVVNACGAGGVRPVAVAEDGYTVSGTVFFALNGRSLEGVTVTSVPVSGGDTTTVMRDAEGRYVVRHRGAPGEFEITYRRIGMEIVRRRVTLSGSRAIRLPAICLRGRPAHGVDPPPPADRCG